MFLLLLVLEVIPLVLSQATHTVSVGVQGSVFDPMTIAAGTNDTIDFLFLGDIHDVTQSTFDKPCSPLEDGFSSGLFGRGVNFTDPTVQWSLIVTNASSPIWFFCAATRPVSHCAQGMVGAINPPSQDAFTRFQNAAKAVSGTPAFFPSLALQGVGATASTPVTLTGADVPPPTSAPSAGAAASASSSTITNVPPSSTNTPTQTPSRSHNAAIIGGSVGGALGAVILLLVSVILCYRIKKRHRSAPDSSLLAYNPQTFGSPPNTGGGTATVGTFSASQTPNYITAFDIGREPNQMTQKQSQSLMRAKSANTLVSDYSNSQVGLQGTYALQPQRYDATEGANGGQFGARNVTVQGLGAIYNENNNPSINRHPSFNAIDVATAEGHSTHHNPAPPRSYSHSVPSADGNVDIHALAQEVAAVLQKGKKAGTVEGGDPEGTHSHTDHTQSPPPRYYSVNN